MDPQDWARTWNLVRADANMRHDVLVGGQQTPLTLQLLPGDGATLTFEVVGAAPPAFAGCNLQLKGTELPDLEAAGLGPLPVYSTAVDGHYCTALDNHLIPYLKADLSKKNGGDLVRLEGVIKIRCGWPKSGTKHALQNPAPHFVNTDVRLYQFKEGVSDGADPKTSTASTLLVMWAPDAPRVPTNPDGSVTGFS
jgi:hypothetical protein